MSHDYSNESTNEDPRMIAFFDYLVQQEIVGWNSESCNDSSDHSSENSSRHDSQTSDTEPPQNRNNSRLPPARGMYGHIFLVVFYLFVFFLRTPRSSWSQLSCWSA